MSNTLDVTQGEQSAVAQLFSEFAGSGLPANKHSNALASSLVISGRCYMVSLTVSNTNAAAQFIQLHDLSSLPADGATPAVVLTAASAGDKFITYSLPGLLFLEGIVVCNSSTAATKTLGAADCFFAVQFIPVVS